MIDAFDLQRRAAMEKQNRTQQEEESSSSDDSDGDDDDAVAAAAGGGGDDDGPAHSKPTFAALGGPGGRRAPVKSELRRVTIPPHRFTPLRNDWENIMKPIVDHMKLQIRVNPRSRCVEMKVCSVRKKGSVVVWLLTVEGLCVVFVWLSISPLTGCRGVLCWQTSPHTTDVGALQKASDFVEAYMMGFDLQVGAQSACIVWWMCCVCPETPPRRPRQTCRQPACPRMHSSTFRYVPKTITSD